MKKLFLFSFNLLAFTACQNTGGESNNSNVKHKIESSTLAKSIGMKAHVRGQENCATDASCLTYNVQYPCFENYPNNEQLNREVNQLISNYLHDHEGVYSGHIEDAFEKFVNEEDFKINYDFIAEAEAVLRDNMVSIRLDVANYTGGANYMYFANSLNIDSKEGKVLSFQDLILSEDALTDLALQYLRIEYESMLEITLEEAGFDIENGLNLSHRIAFSDKDLHILYDKYEIAPGVVGPVSISIPLSELKNIINPNYL